MGWSVWADLFIRSATLLIAGEALRRACRRSSAADRHRLLLLVMGLLVILPFSSALLPSVQVPLWLSHAARGRVSVQTAIFATNGTGAAGNTWSLENWLLVIWLCGALVGVTSVACGRLVLWRISRRSVPVCDARWKALLSELCFQIGMGKEPTLLALPGLAMPLAFGVHRPRILLPGDCMGWTDLRKRVVLLHELAHVQRRDIAAQLFASVAAAIWWFQPLAWMIRRAMRRESEQACDAQAIAAGVRASDYAAELIEIARNAAKGGLWPNGAIAMARPCDLEGRLLRILNLGSRMQARNHFVAAIAALTAIALTASAVTLSSEQKIPYFGGLFMKKTLISGLVATVGLSAATITGSVFDPTGVAISDANVSIAEPDTSIKQETTSTPSGKFSFEGLSAGQYILRIEKPGYTALLREFTLRQSSNVERGFSLQLPATQIDVHVNGEGAAPLPYTGEPTRLRVGGVHMQSKLVNKVHPVYPASAKTAGIQGTVLLDAVVLKDGTLGEITVLSSPSDDLSQASLEAVREWRYAPTLLNGQPIEIVTEIVVNFTLAP